MDTQPVPTGTDDGLDDMLTTLEQAEPTTAVSPAGELAAALERVLDFE